LKNFYRPDRSAIERVDLNEVATSTVSLIHHELVHFTNNFQLALMDGLPAIKGNSQQIGQVMINLLLNACQSLPDKNRGIWLETGYDRTTSQVTLTIRDEGRGMTREESRRVLEPFFTTKLDEGGTGLGLTICKSIIMEHQGDLEFNSKPGKGSTFLVRLPADIPALEE
jgi:signal transduction histidine kinase